MRAQRLREWAESRGCKAVHEGLESVEEVRRRLEERRRNGEFAGGFYERSLAGFKYLEGLAMKDPRGIIVVAFPRSAHTVEFEHGGRTITLLLPPTYVRYRPWFERIRRDLAAVVFGREDAVETLSAPLKSLAVGVGLAAYGRNNVAYVTGMGSYVQLAAYAVDVWSGPSDEDGTVDFKLDRMFEPCASCRYCAEACPTGAISTARFMIDATKCYTLHSESVEPMPPAMKPPSPDCLLGCLRCQRACPANRGLLRTKPSGVRFDEAETAAFLSDAEPIEGPLGDGIRQKLQSLDLTEDMAVLRRNFRLAVEQR